MNLSKVSDCAGIVPDSQFTAFTPLRRANAVNSWSPSVIFTARGGMGKVFS